MSGEALRLSQPDELCIPAGDIQDTVREMAAYYDQLYSEVHSVTIMPVMKGAARFASDLRRYMQRPFHVACDSIRAQSYDGTESTGVVKVTERPKTALLGRHILLVEDILDRGFTLAKIVSELHRYEPASIQVATLLEKPARREPGTDIDAPVKVGMQIDDAFVVGYGLDYNESFRELDHITVMQASADGRLVPAVPRDPVRELQSA